MNRTLTIALLLVLATCICSAQRRPLSLAEGAQPDDTGGQVVIHIHVVFADGRSAGQQVEVRLDSANGGTIATKFTNDEGYVGFPNLHEGLYVVRLRGIHIKPTATGTLNVASFESNHHEYIRVERADTADSSDSAAGTASPSAPAIPENARKEFDKGTQFLSKGDRKSAAQHFQRAIDLYPQFAMAYNNLAAVYMQSKDLTRARQTLDKALAIDPDLSFTLANVARLTLLEHDYAGSLPVIEKGLAKEPTSPEFLYLMCEAQYFTKEYDLAVAYAHKLFRAPHEQFEMAHIFAGRSLESQNRFEEAKSEYERLLKESPTSQHAAEARTSLQRLSTRAASRPSVTNTTSHPSPAK